MRRIWTSTNRQLIDRCQQELERHEISHSVDTEKDLDWGSESYGTIFFSVWAHDDADIERAKAILAQVSGTTEPPLLIPNASSNNPLEQFLRQKFHYSFHTRHHQHLSSRLVTILLTLVCCVLLILDRPHASPSSQSAAAPIASSYTQESLLFDYPMAAILENKLLNEYGPSSLDLTSKLNAEGTALRDLFLQTPYWGGLYTETVVRLSKKDVIPTPSLSLSLFGERIQEGQLWRIFTPALLHGNLFHLFLNMLWLIAVGSQIERKLSSFRYLLLLAIIAAVSNTAQYLMSGPSFMGFSGIICGMIGFTAARQRTAPWEGYAFSQLMYASVLFFIWALVAMAGIAFFLESYLHIDFSISFANTAHLSGLACGLMVGKTNWFRMTSRAIAHRSMMPPEITDNGSND